MSDERSAVGKGYALFLLVVVGMLSGGTWLQSLHLQWGLILSQFVVILAPALVFRRFVRLDYPSLRRPGLSWKWFAYLAVAAAVLGGVANLLTAVFIELIPGMKEFAEQYERMVEQLLRPEDPILAAAGIAAICVVAPICEEFLFRGTILEAHRTEKISTVALCVLNGALFSLLHFNPFGFVALAVVGAFFAHITLLTRSLWPAIFAHGVMNAFNGVLTPMLADGIEQSEPALSELAAPLAVGVVILAALWTHMAKRLDG